jgi:hypothetical protein
MLIRIMMVRQRKAKNVTSVLSAYTRTMSIRTLGIATITLTKCILLKCMFTMLNRQTQHWSLHTKKYNCIFAINKLFNSDQQYWIFGNE